MNAFSVCVCVCVRVFLFVSVIMRTRSVSSLYIHFISPLSFFSNVPLPLKKRASVTT